MARAYAPFRPTTRPTWFGCCRSRKVVALTETTPAIQNPAGAVTTYRRHNKPGLDAVDDSLDDLESPVGGVPHDGR